MTFLITPDLVSAASRDLAGIGSTIQEAAAAAFAPTTQIAAAAADEVSEAIATLFNSHGQTFKTINAQASVFHAEFVQLLGSSAAQYASAEAWNANPLLAAVNTPFMSLFGRPLIGNGADGYTDAAGLGTTGGAGGLLWGNGGRGGDSTAFGAIGGRGGAAGFLFGNGGAGGNGGPGKIIENASGITLVSGAGTGGYGGSGGAIWGNGGTGGNGGALINDFFGVVTVTPNVGLQGLGGNAGLVGVGGTAGLGSAIPGRNGQNGLLPIPWPFG